MLALALCATPSQAGIRSGDRKAAENKRDIYRSLLSDTQGVQALAAEVDQITAQKNTLQSQVNDKKSQFDELNQQVADAQSAVDTNKSEKQDYVDQKNTLTEQTSDKREQILGIREQNAPKEQALKALNVQIIDAGGEKDEQIASPAIVPVTDGA